MKILEGKLLAEGQRIGGQAAKTQVERPIGGIGATRRSTGLHVVGRDNHRHAGDGAHEGDVLVALVRGAVLAHGNSGMSRADLHIEMRIADGIAHLPKYNILRVVPASCFL